MASVDRKMLLQLHFPWKLTLKNIRNINIMKIYLLSLLLPTLFLHNLCFAHSWMAPESEASRLNTIPFSIESVEQGQTLFNSLCASCHGIGATGIPKEDTGLDKDTPDLPKRLMTHTDGDYHWKILNGNSDMPSFKDELSEEETWYIINYIRSLIKK